MFAFDLLFQDGDLHLLTDLNYLVGVLYKAVDKLGGKVRVVTMPVVSVL